MGWSLNLGRVFGIRIRAHWGFLVLMLWAWRTMGGLPAVMYLCCLFGFVVLHELGHSLVARRFGVRVHDIILTPIGGMARLEGLPPTPKAELWIAVAGPLVNIALALLLTPVVVLLCGSSMSLRSAALGSAGIFLLTLLLMNVVLAVFNLLPAFPMDGGRILRAWWARRWGMLEATRKAVRVGRWTALLMAIAGVYFTHLMLIVIALFVFLAGTREQWAVRLRYAQARVVDMREPTGGPAGPAFRQIDPRVLEEMLRRMREEMSRKA